MTLLRPFVLLGLLLAGCTGPAPGPSPPAPAEAGVDPHYEQAYAALRVHPAVQAFAAQHLAPSEPMAIEVSPELVPAAYALLAPAIAQHEAEGSVSEAHVVAVRDSLAALSPTLVPATDEALPHLSRRQRRPLVLFFSPLDGDRLAARLYPNPYRRRTYEAVREEAPGLALLIVFESGRVAQVYAEEIAP